MRAEGGYPMRPLVDEAVKRLSPLALLRGTISKARTQDAARRSGRAT